VYAISIPAEVRQMIDEMKDVNWQSEIGQQLRNLSWKEEDRTEASL